MHKVRIQMDTAQPGNQNVSYVQDTLLEYPTRTEESSQRKEAVMLGGPTQAGNIQQLFECRIIYIASSYVKSEIEEFPLRSRTDSLTIASNQAIIESLSRTVRLPAVGESGIVFAVPLSHATRNHQGFGQPGGMDCVEARGC